MLFRSGDEDGEVDDGLRTTANSLGYSSVLGAAPLLGFVVPSSGEMRTVTKSTVRSPMTKIELGLGFGIEREREWGRRQSLECSLPSSRSSMAERPRPPNSSALARIGQSYATTEV